MQVRQQIMMFWVDFATCHQGVSVRSAGNTLQNPRGEAEAAKRRGADVLMVPTEAGLGYRKQQ